MATPTRIASRPSAAEGGLASPPTGGRSPVRTAVLVICLLTVSAVFAGVARQLWSSSVADSEVVRLEAHGAAMLHPMTTLLTELVEAQSAAVRGEAVDQAGVQTALVELFEPDGLFGDDLQTSQRLSDLSDQVQAAFSAEETGRPAYQRYASLVDLTVDLIRVIGDNSHLIHDPDLDTYYLMDAATVRLPHAMVYAGRAADLVALAGETGELSGEDAVRAAVARFNVASDAERVTTGLTTSVDFTESSDLGTNIVQRLDAFGAAADAFAPPTMLQELATTVDPSAMAQNASRVFTAATALTHLLLQELEDLLAVRAERLGLERRFTVIACVAAALLGIVMLGLLALPDRQRFRRKGRPVEEPTTGGRGFPALPARDEPTGRDAPARRGGDLADSGTRRTGHAR